MPRLGRKKANRLLDRALRVAADAHGKQFDRGGNPYLLHILRVMGSILHYNDVELTISAILHDAVEDGRMTLSDLQEEGFSQRIINTLTLLTREERVSYDSYIQRIGTSLDATRIKLADLLDNMDTSRLKQIKEKDLERLNKYKKSYKYLTEILNEQESQIV